MTDYSALGFHQKLTFHSPLSEERAQRLTRNLAARHPLTVLDLGCGWGELLLRIVEATPGATGVGRDTFAPDIVRAQAEADRRGLADRVTFTEGPAADHQDTADLVICSGAHQAFGTIPEALAALRKLVNPGGRLLFADGFWERTPTDADLARMWPDTAIDVFPHLPDLVDMALAAGFRPLRIETSTPAEWEEFESGIGEAAEEWLLDNGNHPEADAVRTKLDQNRAFWLRGHRDFLGYAFLTLGVPSTEV